MKLRRHERCPIHKSLFCNSSGMRFLLATQMAGQFGINVVVDKICEGNARCSRWRVRVWLIDTRKPLLACEASSRVGYCRTVPMTAFRRTHWPVSSESHQRNAQQLHPVFLCPSRRYPR
jgi:hypothetical protein